MNTARYILTSCLISHMVNTGRIWVTGTTCLIAFIAYSPQFSGLFSGCTRTQLVIFNILVGFIYFNYVLVVKTDPGAVPQDWKPVPVVLREQSGHASQNGTNSGEHIAPDIGDLRYCKKCENFKAPRSHHCRYCKRCTLRFDHHCPWINNCVGFHNYVYFLRFLFFVDLSCAMHLYLLTFSAFNIENYRNRRDDPGPVEVAFLVLNYVLCIPVLITVGLFSLYHYWNLAANTTTIEGSEIDRVKKMVRRGKITEIVYPFNVGILANVTSTIGYTPFEWLVFGKPAGDGLSFPHAEGSDPLRWPPRDPYDALKESWEREAAANRAVPRSRYPPYHPAHSALDAQDDDGENRYGDPPDRYYEESSSGDEGDDDVPLAQLRHRSVRLRRGSEGLEVRPRGLGVGHLDIDILSSSEDEPVRLDEPHIGDDSDWEELYERRHEPALYDSGSDDE